MTMKYHDGNSYVEVNKAHPLPVKAEIPVSTPVHGRMVYIGPVGIPGIAAGDALDAGDAFGTKFSFLVPPSGAIVNFKFFDFDDEAIDKELWLFRSEPTGIASDAAFALADTDLRKVIDVIRIEDYRDGQSGQIGFPVSGNLPIWYSCPSGRMWGQFWTIGTDNIAAGSMPAFSMVIERYSEG